MCGPPAFAIAAAALAAGGQIVGALSANAQARYRAKVAESNADLKREETRYAMEANRRDAQNHYRRMAQLKGEQRVAAGAGGVAAGFGTAADIVSDTDMLGREDIAALYKQGDLNVRGLDRSVSNFEAEANAARAAGKSALIQGAFGAASTALGGASQYSSMSGNYGTPSPVTPTPATPTYANWYGSTFPR